MAVIEIEGLAKSYRVYQKQEGLLASIRGLFRRRYRTVEAVCGIDMTVERGEFVAFLGPNGAGKTTTLKLLSGVINPTSGTARVLGHIPWKRENAYRRRFALVMGQKNQLWWDLPANESFRLHQEIYRIERGRFERTRDELTSMLEVRHLLGQPVRELSLGERMKMELIAALLHSPEVLFLDEPTIGLDVRAQYTIQNFLRYYQQERRVTILLTSHYMKDVSVLCRRVVIINSGRIVYDGSLNGIIDRFSGHKVISLQFTDGRVPGSLGGLGEVLSPEPPRAKLRVPRGRVTEVLTHLLAQHHVEDISVEDPPLEEVIARMFARCEERPTECELGHVPELLGEE
ncbi:MAG TPA: ATP-binding cassette domain-containing protein [Planctomycetaceae bacterium]|nr:ATP-binding cassette domain-containing protein [Planctomycetaceae bacterium]HIQ22030.1 ATP-binding cassette domain-containing protein [Planctomycetota bacterium]